MHIKIELSTENAAFEMDEAREVARILSVLANAVAEEGLHDRKLRDYNGNVVGQVEVREV